MPEQAPSINVAIARARLHLRVARVLMGLCLWLAGGLGFWLALCLLDNLLHLPPGLRLPFAIAGVMVTGGLLLKKVLLPAWRPPTLEALAIMLEKMRAVPDNVVINALQFERADLAPEERFFAVGTINASRGAIRQTRPADFWNARKTAAWAGLALTALLLWILYATLLPHNAANAWRRLAWPLSDIPPVGAATLKMTPAADVVINAGESLTVSIELEPWRGAGKKATQPEMPQPSEGRADFMSAKAGVKPALPPTLHNATEELPQPPLIARREGLRGVDPARPGKDMALMSAVPGRAECFAFSFMDVRRPFAFRVFAAGTYSPGVRVDVRAPPRITESLFTLRPPAYTGLNSTNRPGPPAPLACLPGTALKTSLVIEPFPAETRWSAAETSVVFKRNGARLEAETVIATGGCYAVEAFAGPTGLPVRSTQTGRPAVLAKGEINLLPDLPPEVAFATDNLNRFVVPGSELTLEIRAADDYGLSNLTVSVAGFDAGPAGERALKTWSYLGPPGPRGPVRERLNLQLEPEIFDPGVTYVLTASAGDFQPHGRPGRSQPLILRVKAADDLSLAPTDSLENAFAILKRAIAAQEKAKGLTANLTLHLDEAVEKKTIPEHRQAMTNRQTEARREGAQALAKFREKPEGAPYAARLEPLVNGEMPLALEEIARIVPENRDAIPEHLESIEDRQAFILAELIKLLGLLAEKDGKTPAARSADAEARQPDATPTLAGAELKDDLEEFVRQQQRIVEQSRSLADRGPDDLTGEEQKILGALAREESKWAAFFEEKLTDFSKLPQQDFADGSVAKELNEVVQEVKLASKSLYDKAVELAVPYEQSGLENAEELLHNLERWISNQPDNLKWLMEEPLAPADIALAELPGELEDIVGELIDKEEDMTADVEDVSSSWLDSIDKGAGWGAMDGPISSMSAKGITGNMLPNQQEIGGRSGEGRTGRSHGQMVEETAAGKGGRKTPTRLTPGPFEQGSIKDTSKEDPGGVTGGGKLAGSGAEGLRGPTPPPLKQAMARLSGQQAAIRQEAEALALKLRKYHLPTGDLESSVQKMREVEEAARLGYGGNIRQSFSRVMDALRDAKQSVRAETGLHREQNRLPDKLRGEIVAGLEDGIPKGYEEMAGAYFRALAESGAQSSPRQTAP